MSGAGCVSCCRARRCNLMGKSQILSRASYFKRWYQSCLATPVFFWGVGISRDRPKLAFLLNLITPHADQLCGVDIAQLATCSSQTATTKHKRGATHCAVDIVRSRPGWLYLWQTKVWLHFWPARSEKDKRNISPEQDGWALAFTRRSNFNFLLSEILSNFSGVASKCLLIKSSVCLVRATTS